MAETLQALDAHLSCGGRAARIVVWEHNSHVGDARATEMGTRGEVNVGQLARERYASTSVLIGFTTYSGTVTAASDWDSPAERKQVRPATVGSYETLFHATDLPAFEISLRERPLVGESLRNPRMERAIGVIFRLDTERMSHYSYARLPEQCDAVIHFDHTRAVEPLARTAEWQRGEVPETFPVASVPRSTRGRDTERSSPQCVVEQAALA